LVVDDVGELPLALEGAADHYDHRLEDDHWGQPGNLFWKMTPGKNSCSSKTRLAQSMALRRFWSGMLRTAEDPILSMAMVCHKH
jgi:hypothetical protein